MTPLRVKPGIRANSFLLVLPEEKSSKSPARSTSGADPAGANWSRGSERLAVSRARISMWCEFEDDMLEAEYMQGVRAKIGRRTAAVATATSAFGGALALTEGFITGFAHMTVYYYMTIYVTVWLAYALYARVPWRVAQKTAWLESLYAVIFVCTNLPFILLVHALPVEFSDTRTTDESITILMNQLLVVSLSMAYAPFRLRTSAAIVLASVSMLIVHSILVVATSHVGASSELKIFDRFVTVGAIIIVELIMFGCCARLNNIHRVSYHFYRACELELRTAEAAVAENARMQGQEIARELELRIAEAAMQARSRLIRMVMHDLRSPLLSMANSAAVIADIKLNAPETCLDDPTIAECHLAIATCSELSQNIISDMLDFERIDSGKLVLVPVNMRISQLLHAAAHTFRGLASVKGVTLSLEPLQGEPLLIGDVRRLQQCVNNGVSNAIKFTEPGGSVTIRARLGNETQSQTLPRKGQPPQLAGAPANDAQAADTSAEADPTFSLVVLEVEDTGAGLSADELLVVNEGEAFTQVGKGQLQGNGGTGLGLTIVREIIRLHTGSRMCIHAVCLYVGVGGRLTSAGAGRGSIFQLELNLLNAPDGSGVQQRSRLPRSSAGRRASGSCMWRTTRCCANPLSCA
ncbi:hypothetical protein T492DRAFT_282840 [Pavlovales sp. CCMP2436]|nr:hypothetical protein T492DRAFT_282840 [Pavlovales sp. CCMP2436]